jgi:hypothetical protein
MGLTQRTKQCVRKKAGARRPCPHTVTPDDMQSLLTLWRVTRLTLCRLKWGNDIADFKKER